MAGKLFKVTVRFEYQGLNGGNSGESTTTQAVLSQPEMEYLRRRVTEEMLRFGIDALKADGEDVIDTPPYAGK